MGEKYVSVSMPEKRRNGILLKRESYSGGVAHRLLVVGCIAIIHMLIMACLYRSQLILKFPHFLKTENIAVIIFMTVTFLYLRIRIKGKELRPADCFYIIPLLLYMGVSWPIFALPAAQKTWLISASLHQAIPQIPNGLSSFASFCMYAVVLFYLWQDIRLLALQIFNLRLWPVKGGWASELVLVFLMLFFISAFFIRSTHLEAPQCIVCLYLWGAASSLLIAGILFVPKAIPVLAAPCVSALVAGIPYLFMDFGFKRKDENNGGPVAAALSDKIQWLSPGQIKHIDELVKKYIVKEQRFLQPRYSLKVLSEDTRIPVYQLSLFMNKFYRTSYNDFVNRLRVRYCCEKIAAGECALKTLEALAAESGFNNRTSFTHSFKKFTGFTPSEFLRRMTASGSFEAGLIWDQNKLILQPETN